MEIRSKKLVQKLELPELTKDYKNMSSRELNLEISDISKELVELEKKSAEVRTAAIGYIKKNMADPGSSLRTLFKTDMLNERRLNIINKPYLLKSNLKQHLEGLLSKKIEEELTANFLSENEKLKDLVSEIEIAKTPIGDILQVVMK